MKVEGRDDGILAQALKTGEHSGRLRGTGGFITPSTYSRVPTKKSDVVSAEVFLEQKRELEEQRQQNIEMDKRLKKLEAVIYKKGDAFDIETDDKGSCSVKNLPKVNITKSPLNDDNSDDDVKIVDEDAFVAVKN